MAIRVFLEILLMKFLNFNNKNIFITSIQGPSLISTCPKLDRAHHTEPLNLGVGVFGLPKGP